jgi:lipoyl(octanoyl) transferase
VVLHGEDLTYSLLVPAGGERVAAAGSYRIIHGALCDAFCGIGISAEYATYSLSMSSSACFENPVMHDVLVEGRKVAGAAQRRTRGGLIHQGSIQSLHLPAGFGIRFASYLAAEVSQRSFDVTDAAEKLAGEKYGTRAWLEKRL